MKKVVPHWQTQASSGAGVQPIRDLFNDFQLDQFTEFPKAAQLNRLAATMAEGNWNGPDFIAQGEIGSDDGRYYEQYIYETRQVPTREDSWHDLFNALIWMQFPLTKQHLNQLHMLDIQASGLHPRTPRRNRLTHFDECGVVLAVPEHLQEQANHILTALAAHRWVEALWDNRDWWGEAIVPLVFGHANLEMLLQPFIGLTGKWMAVVVPETFTGLSPVEQRQSADLAMLQRIQLLGNFSSAQMLRPLPLLGVPGWYSEQTLAFYLDTDHFRPQRPETPKTIQLPL